MNLSEIFIKRPVATILLAIGICLGGSIGYKLLPVSPLPQIEFPVIVVQAILPGASPTTMATAVATPLERRLGQIAGVNEMTSTSNVGSTRIIVQFDLSRTSDSAARDVQAAINASLSDLPSDLPYNPTYLKVNPADPPIMVITLTSDIIPAEKMFDVASSVLQQELSQIMGVGQVLTSGSSLPAVRIELNPMAINKYGLNLEDVRTFLANTNVTRPKGQITYNGLITDIATNDQLFQAKEYENLVVTVANGTPIYLKDLAHVKNGVEDVSNKAITDGKSAVALIVYKEPGANIIEVVNSIYTVMPRLQAALSPTITLTAVMDRTTTIRASVADVQWTLLLAIVLVIGITYAFLGNGRAALIASMVIPLSLLATFGIMYLLKYTLDNLSLMALTIAIGFVIDDAVVVLENIMRRLDEGQRPLEAALKGAQDVGFTVLSMSISLLAIFIPLLFMGGIVGRLFREFAVVLAISILTSMVISLSVTPMLCAKLLRNTTPNPFLTRLMHRLTEFYERTLHMALQRKRLMLLTTPAAVGLMLILAMITPKGFFPLQDTGRLNGSIQAEQHTSFEALQEKLATYVNIIKSDEAIEHVTGIIGGTQFTSNAGGLYISLKPLEERKISSEEVIARLRGKLAQVPGSTLYLKSSQDLSIGGRSSNAQYIFSLSTYELDTLNTWGPKVLEKLKTFPHILDMNSDQLDQSLQTYVTLDREAIGRLGLNVLQIDNLLYDAFGQRQVSVLYTPMNQYHVVMIVAPEYWKKPETLNQLYLKSPEGTPIPLSAFSSFENSQTLLAVTHQGGLPAATFSFNLAHGTALGQAVQSIQQAMKDMGLPASVSPSFQGRAQAFQESMANTPYLILAALVAVYIVLGILYESALHPVTIISTLPSAGLGTILALFMTRTDLDILAIIGIILLIGIVKKNAIMMIDVAITLERTQKIPTQEAIFQACRLRFRPILMTTMAAALSALPLALGQGVGSELRKPMGIAIVGGLIVSQILTLYTTPVIYLTFESWRKEIQAWRQNMRQQGKGTFFS